MPSTEPCSLQTFVLFPISHWDDMLAIVAEKFGKASIEDLCSDPEGELFQLFAAAEGETEPTHRLCCFQTTIPQFRHYRRDMPAWVTIECFRVEHCVSPREFLSTRGMTLLDDITLSGLFQ